MGFDDLLDKIMSNMDVQKASAAEIINWSIRNNTPTLLSEFMLAIKEDIILPDHKTDLSGRPFSVTLMSLPGGKPKVGHVAKEFVVRYREKRILGFILNQYSDCNKPSGSFPSMAFVLEFSSFYIRLIFMEK